MVDASGTVHSVKVGIGISCLTTVPSRAMVAPRRGYYARAGPSSRASVGRLACRTSLSTAGGTVSSPHRRRRSRSSGTKGWRR